MRGNTIEDLIAELLAVRDSIDNIRAKHKGEDKYVVSDEILAEWREQISDATTSIQDAMDDINGIIGL